MSHIVIHDDADGVTRYQQFDDQQSAVAYLEEQQNRYQTSGGKLYVLREVPFEVKFKIEVVDRDDDRAEQVLSASDPWAGAPVGPDEIAAPNGEASAEAVSSEPIEAFASETFAVTGSAHANDGRIGSADQSNRDEVRRGLFGR